jgi:hypothetical protein
MATAPFRLTNSVVAMLRKLSEMTGITMADWVRERIRAEENELNTRVQPEKEHPSLVRDLWAHGRSTPEGRQFLKHEILQGLKENRYDLSEVGIDQLSPLHWAVWGNDDADVELVDAIIEKAHAVSPRDYYGNTPLVLAIYKQDPRHEKNLPVIQLLLKRSHDEDLLVKPSLFGGNQGIFDYAKSRGMEGTVTLIRERFQRFNLESSLNASTLSVFDVAERVSQILYYQGRSWTTIAAELKQRGFEDSVVWYHLHRLGAWKTLLEELKLRGDSDPVCVSALRELEATWADIAWAYLQNGFPSEEIVGTLYPLLKAETTNRGTLSWMVAGSIAPDDADDLRPVRVQLEALGEDPQQVVAGMPYIRERKVRILHRMGLKIDDKAIQAFS